MTRRTANLGFHRFKFRLARQVRFLPSLLKQKSTDDRRARAYERSLDAQQPRYSRCAPPLQGWEAKPGTPPHWVPGVSLSPSEVAAVRGADFDFLAFFDEERDLDGFAGFQDGLFCKFDLRFARRVSRRGCLSQDFPPGDICLFISSSWFNAPKRTACRNSGV